MIPIRTYEGRHVAVFGLARSGLAAARALEAGGAHVHAWDDNPAARARAEAEGVALSDFNARDWRDFAALVVSPGVPLTFPSPHRVVDLARAVGVPMIGDIELFAQAIQALAPSMRPKVIGVTGTNGKSTTTALIGHILESTGRDVRVGGNIGAAVLDLKPLHAGAHYVLELSSYQLELTQSLRCDAAVFLNLTPDHLDRHGTMENYFAAKMRIFDNQGAGDWAIVGVDDPWGEQACTHLKASARTVAPVSAGQSVARGVFALGGAVYDALIGRSELVAHLAAAAALPGAHNAQNIAAAYSACRAMGVAPADIARALASFPGLAHRLERVGLVDGVMFINDSKATNADAAAQALRAFPHVYWLAGGRAKEGGVAALAPFFQQLKGAYLFGESGAAFADTIAAHAPDGLPICRYETLDQAARAAFAAARRETADERIVLLSPACASFDQYTDFEARGAAFKAIIADLSALVGAGDRGGA
jgi:UDP-N-acetylmuramoylalanine--D-glutamate ligase